MTPIEWLCVRYGVSQADIDAAVAQARQEERERWRNIVENLALHHSGAVQAALWSIAEMMDRNIAYVSVQLNAVCRRQS